MFHISNLIFFPHKGCFCHYSLNIYITFTVTPHLQYFTVWLDVLILITGRLQYFRTCTVKQGYSEHDYNKIDAYSKMIFIPCDIITCGKLHGYNELRL